MKFKTHLSTLDKTYFGQSVLHKGINITCKGLFGYRYQLKGPQTFLKEFLAEFVDQLNKTIKNQTSRILVIDVLALISEIPLVIVLLVFSSSSKYDQTVTVILSIVVILSSIIFIYLKISGNQLLSERIQEFVDQKKDLLAQRGLRGFVVRARWNDKAPEVFLNLLPEKLVSGIETSYSEDIKHSSQQDNTIYHRLPGKPSSNSNTVSK